MSTRRRKSGLVIPSGIADAEPPAFGCAVCKATFTRHEAAAYQRHVVDCARRHADELEQLSPRVKAPGIFGESELEEWARRHKDAIREGRKKL